MKVTKLFVFVFSLVFNVMLITYLFTGNDEFANDTTRPIWSSFSEYEGTNWKCYGNMNAENWENMSQLHQRYAGLISDFRYLLIYDLVQHGNLDTILINKNRKHFSLGLLKTTPDSIMEELRSKITYELDSVYYDYMNSINYIYCHTKTDSLEILKSDTYQVFKNFTNEDYEK